MAGIRDIQPLHPTFPKRPNDKVDKHRDLKEREKKQPTAEEKEDDDGQPHVDEFA